MEAGEQGAPSSTLMTFVPMIESEALLFILHNIEPRALDDLFYEDLRFISSLLWQGLRCGNLWEAPVQPTSPFV